MAAPLQNAPPPPPPPGNGGPGTPPRAWATARTAGLDRLAALVLGLAVLAAAVAAYSAGRWDEQSLEGYSASVRDLSEANQSYTAALTQRTLDEQLFAQLAVAEQRGEAELAGFIQRELMSAQLSAAVDWWRDTDEATTPFDQLPGNPYDFPALSEAERINSASFVRFEEGTHAAERADRFELATILLMITLFAAGVGPLARPRSVSTVVCGLSLVVLVAGLAVLVAAFLGD